MKTFVILALSAALILSGNIQHATIRLLQDQIRNMRKAEVELVLADRELKQADEELKQSDEGLQRADARLKAACGL